jgi:hypothetical protein
MGARNVSVPVTATVSVVPNSDFDWIQPAGQYVPLTVIVPAGGNTVVKIYVGHNGVAGLDPGLLTPHGALVKG